jgi:hypothetical protein
MLHTSLQIISCLEAIENRHTIYEYIYIEGKETISIKFLVWNIEPTYKKDVGMSFKVKENQFLCGVSLS